MKKNYEEPNFEKTEFEAVAYLCNGSNGSNQSNSNNEFRPDRPSHGWGGPDRPGRH